MDIHNLMSSYSICLHCAGHSQEQCFCSTLQIDTPISRKQFISSSNSTNLQYPKKMGSRQLKKDNDAHKRLSIVLKKIYRMLIGKKVDEKYRKFYYRQDFIFIILSLLENKGKIVDAQVKFKERIKDFEAEIEDELVSQPMYHQELRKLIRKYEIAFPVWMDGNHKQSMKIFYDYDHMRQKKNFETAVQYIEQARRQLGLPFAE